jgi:uncharacterized protein (TIGR03435 family)
MRVRLSETGAAAILSASLFSLLAVAQDRIQPEFEVASVKAAAFGQSLVQDRGGADTASQGSWVCRNMPLDLLVLRAWDLFPYQLPERASLNAVRLDIDARYPAGTGATEFKMMIRGLLAKRVGLSVHLEPRDQPVYDLVVAQDGLKMRDAVLMSPKQDESDPVILWEQGRPRLRPGTPKTDHVGLAGGVVVYMGTMQGIRDLIRTFSGRAGRPIIDKTNLTGKYDYTLEFVLTQPSPTSSGAPSTTNGTGVAVAPDASQPGASFPVALEKQLGLKLVPNTGRFDVLVVDHFSKVPTEN